MKGFYGLRLSAALDKIVQDRENEARDEDKGYEQPQGRGSGRPCEVPCGSIDTLNLCYHFRQQRGDEYQHHKDHDSILTIHVLNPIILNILFIYIAMGYSHV